MRAQGQQHGHRWVLGLACVGLVVGCVAGGARPAAAATHCFGPYALTASSPPYYPASAGDDIRDWWGDFSVNLLVTSGSLSVNVEAKLDGADFVSLGTMTTTTLTQFRGPLHRLRFNVTACTTCVATIIACGVKYD